MDSFRVHLLRIYLYLYLCVKACVPASPIASPSLSSRQRLHHAVLSEQWDQLFSRLRYLLCAGLHGLRAERPHRGRGRIW